MRKTNSVSLLLTSALHYFSFVLLLPEPRKSNRNKQKQLHCLTRWDSKAFHSCGERFRTGYIMLLSPTRRHAAHLSVINRERNRTLANTRFSPSLALHRNQRRNLFFFVRRRSKSALASNLLRRTVVPDAQLLRSIIASYASF